MSGYCATGSVNSAIMSPNTTTMESTAAKIGRSMKNFENKAVSPKQVRFRRQCFVGWAEELKATKAHRFFTVTVGIGRFQLLSPPYKYFHSVFLSYPLFVGSLAVRGRLAIAGWLPSAQPCDSGRPALEQLAQQVWHDPEQSQ